MLVQGARSLMAQVQYKKDSNPLVNGIGQVLFRMNGFKKLAKEFYFDVILSVHQCSDCGGRIWMSGKSECTCGCGKVFDPTLVFQQSPCCGVKLVRKTLHYVCSRCQRTVPSTFLFDERLFDKAYFREMVRVSRARARKRRGEIRRLLAGSRSEALTLMEEPCLESIPGLIQDLNDFIQGNGTEACDFNFDSNPCFRMNDYRKHILSVLGWDSLLFSDIAPLIDDRRRDRIWRFVTIIFMQNDREVMLTQYGNDFLIERTSNEAYE